MQSDSAGGRAAGPLPSARERQRPEQRVAEHRPGGTAPRVGNLASQAEGARAPQKAPLEEPRIAAFDEGLERAPAAGPPKDEVAAAHRDHVEPGREAVEREAEPAE